MIGLIQRLPDTSLTSALASGGREHFGWGMDRHIAVDQFDAINQNTRASGRWGKKGPPNIPGFPRPASVKKEEEKKRTSVRDLFAKFSRR